MKKATLLFITLLSLVFVGCDKEDDPKPIIADESLIPGVWDLIELKVEDGKTTTEILGQPVSANYTTEGKNFMTTVTFSDNPNEVVSTGTYDAVITTTLLGQTTTQEVPVQKFTLEGSWEVEGDQLTISNPSQPLNEETATITELTNERMGLRIDINTTLDQAGTKVTTTGTASYVLKKR